MPSPVVGFRATGPLAQQLDARVDADGERATTARRDLSRYYATLSSELATVAAQLGQDEALALADVLNGSLVDEQLVLVRHLDHELADGLEDGLAEKWDIDGPGLVTIVQAWTTSQRLAVVDAVERWWRRTPTEGETDEDSLRAVGLVKGAR